MIIRDVHCTHAMFEIFSLRVVHRLRARIAAIECLAPLPSGTLCTAFWSNTSPFFLS